MKNWKGFVVAAVMMTSPSVVNGQAKGETVTVEGCVVREADAPGRLPPEDLRGNVIASDNYVLHTTAVVKGAAPAGTAGPLMFMIKDIKKTELKPQVGRRVQIDGILDKTDRAKNKVVFANALVELKGTSIRFATGACK